MARMRAAYDLDGVVYDFISSFDIFMASAGFKINRTSYDIGTRYDTDRETGFKCLGELRKLRVFNTMPLIRKAKKQMMYDSKRAEIFIITGRNPKEYGRIDTIERIIRDKLPVDIDNIHFREDKGQAALEFKIDLFYEDVLKNGKDILEKSNARVVLVDNTYNKTKDKRFVRVKWLE